MKEQCEETENTAHSANLAEIRISDGPIAASLFDGNDVAINIMHRTLPSTGTEMILSWGMTV